MDKPINAIEPQVNTSKPVMNVGDAATYACIGKRTMWDLIAKGELKAVRIGRRVVVRRCDIDEFLESHVI